MRLQLNLARVLRPAGTLNFKHEPPRPVRCVRLELDAYTAEEVVGGLDDDQRYRPRATPATPATPGRLAHAGRALEGLVTVVRDSGQGERNRRLFWSSCRAGEHIQAGRLDANTTVAALRDAALQTGLPEFEVDRTIRSGFQAGEAA